MGKLLDTPVLDTQGWGPLTRVRVGLAAALAIVATQYAWNAVQLPPLVGYDAPGHAGFIASIARDGRLPHPLSGWSTFHPPLYHVASSLVWRTLEPWGPGPLSAGLRGLGALAWLGAGGAMIVLLRRLGAAPATVAASALLFWLVPSNQLSAVMVGNEAFAAAMATLALVPLCRLQADPGDRAAALAAGGLAGAALASKFSGAWVSAACAVPFLRAGLLRTGMDARPLQALALCALAGALIAGPVYVRNLATTGTPFPMTRELGPMKSAEDALVLRPRRVADYVGLAPGALRRPSIYHVPDAPGSWAGRNESMTNVWSLAYAGLWYDAHAHRVPIAMHRDDVVLGPLLLLLGLVPTALLVVGFVSASVAAFRSRLRSPDAPLVVLALLALVSFAGFTWHAPSLAAAKASYLLPAAGPAAWFFARATDRVRGAARRAVLAVAVLAGLASGAIFTAGFAFDPGSPRVLVRSWLYVARELPEARIDEALRVLYGSEAEPERGPSGRRAPSLSPSPSSSSAR